MKKSIRAVALLLLLTILSTCLLSCREENAPAASETVAPTCSHDYAKKMTPAMPLREGSYDYTCRLCGNAYSETIPATKTLKILAVGNSFSVDAMEHLWGLCNSAGVTKVILGNLYIGGCTLDTHYETIRGENASYVFYKNTRGKWIETKNVSAQDAIANEAWDIITVQQSSKTCGLPSSYSMLGRLLSLLRELAPNASIYFHMTWAYQQDSTHTSFPNYKNDQMTMYQMTVDTVKSCVLTQPDILGVIPAGTAIQNLRTSYLGDTLTRDGYHLSFDRGRFTAALTWFAYFTGGDLSAVTWVPNKYPYVSEDLPAMLEAAAAAIASPYEVTRSTHTEK